MRPAAVALLLAILTAGCNGTAPASPAHVTPPDAEAPRVDAGFVVCPNAMDASFGSIYALMLSTPGCGGSSDGCHSTQAASAKGLGHQLDLSRSAEEVYAELVGADGGGVVSVNVYHPGVRVLRVSPGDAGASMLYEKLVITSSNNPRYGSGMPLTAPGSVCPAAVDAMKAWIDAGAHFDGVAVDAGAEVAADAGVDMSGDGDADASGDGDVDADATSD